MNSRPSSLQARARARRPLGALLAASLLLLLAPPIRAAGTLQSAQIEELRRAARQAFEQGHLTTPANANANQLADRLLALHPGDRVALELKQKVLAACLDLGRQALERGDFTAAEAAVRAAFTVDPGDDGASGLAARIQRARAAPPAAPAEPDAAGSDAGGAGPDPTDGDPAEPDSAPARLAVADGPPADPAHREMIAAFNRAERDRSYATWADFLLRYPESDFYAYALGELRALSVGTISISCSDRGTARVLFDGRPAGETPLVLERIEAGSHSVALERAFHEPYVTDVLLPPAGQIAVVAELTIAEPLFEAVASHRHARGGCKGRLRLASDHLEFEPIVGPDSILLLWRDIGELDVTNPRAISLTSSRTLKSFQFDLEAVSLSPKLIGLLHDLHDAALAAMTSRPQR